MKKIVVSICALLLSSGLLAQEILTVKGTIAGDNEGYSKIYVYGNEVDADSVVMVDGAFEFNIPFKKGMVPMFFTEHHMKTKKMYSPFPAVVDRSGVLILEGAEFGKEINQGRWRGIPSAVDYQLYQEGMDEAFAALKGTQMSEEERDNAVQAKTQEVLTVFIRRNPDSYAAAYALNSAKSRLTKEVSEQLYQMLSAGQQQSNAGKSVDMHIQGLRKSALGSQVEDFTLAGPEGVEVQFAKLKGKYVLIDFWASWCGPCKQSFPHMKEIYKRFQSDEFEIYSISIDKDREAWLKESSVQQLPWLQTLDTKHVAQQQFAITAVPTTYLIDPNGKILMKEIGFDSSGKGEIEQKLKALFPSK